MDKAREVGAVRDVQASLRGEIESLNAIIDREMSKYVRRPSVFRVAIK